MSGLVGTLRAINADDPVELHDLGGYDAAQVAELVQGAFAQPFPARAPVKVCYHLWFCFESSLDPRRLPLDPHILECVVSLHSDACLTMNAA